MRYTQARKWRIKVFRPFALRKVYHCALAIQYIICSMVGRSIASTYFQPRRAFTSVLRAFLAVYIGYSPAYCTTYIYIYIRITYRSYTAGNIGKGFEFGSLAVFAVHQPVTASTEDRNK